MALSGEQEFWEPCLRHDPSRQEKLGNAFPRRGPPPRWSDLDVRGDQLARDLWLRKDLGTFRGGFSALVPRHGVLLVEIGRARTAVL